MPAIPKLLATDYNTIVNAMNLINAAKDRKKIEEVTKHEARLLMEKWFRPDFMPLMMKYMQSLKNKKPQAKM